MVKDLIIGGASNYTWAQLKNWINSIKACGFLGDIVITTTSMSSETIKKLNSENIQLLLIGELDSQGNLRSNNQLAPHVERFLHIYHYLNSITTNYRYVITTDTRDVIFQSNPSNWLENNLGESKLICASEGLRYKDEPWSNNNLQEAFGEYCYNIYKNEIIYNVGTIAGEFKYLKDLLFILFQMSINRPIPIVDQAVFNILINNEPYKSIIYKSTHKDAWAVQLGTTSEAVLAGSGDIGIKVKQQPGLYNKYKSDYLESPIIIYDNKVLNHEKIPFVIVHQYDRIPSLARVI